jgi:CheY-like chemotaxis protein
MLVQGDPARLVQVVSNLLTNAAKYTPPGGQIAVIASADDDNVQLRVLDNGIGMSSEIVDQVFDVFVQGRQTIERAHGGLGLGLAIVKSLVERHGGTVSAHSAGPNQGSEFVVRLPRAAPGTVAHAEHERAAAAAIATNRARVLVVDDNEDAAEMLAAMLGTYNCEVSVAHDALQALRSAAEASFELALLDIGLPVIDGYELAGRLRELPHLAATRLVAVTGYGQESDRQRALAAGFEAHLVKPVDRATIEKVVASLRNEE